MEYNKLKEYVETTWDFLCFVFHYIDDTDFVL
jgi:hypothetical protein